LTHFIEYTHLGKFKDSFTATNLSKHEHLLIRVGTPGKNPLAGPEPLPLEKYAVTKSGTTYLSDLYYIMKYGDAPRMDVNYKNGAILVNGIKYPKGVGCRNNSRIMFKLNGKADRFQAVVGLDDSNSGGVKGRFRVLNEDFFGHQVLFDSGSLNKEKNSVNIDIDVKGVGYILLMFEGEKALGNWADVKVIAQ